MPKIVRLLTACAAALLAGAATAAEPEGTPPGGMRLELGGGLGLLARPDYVGSSEFSTTVLPVPYVSYHDDRIDLTRDGLVARLFHSDRVKLGMSLSASLPGKKSSARDGMPDLLPTFEAGPSLDVHLGDAGGAWDLRLPVRAVAAADFNDFKGIGWIAYPHLQFERNLQVGTWAVETSAGIGPLWGSREYHRYFYRVKAKYATQDRPEYDPDDGYTGSRVTGYLGLVRDRWHIGLGVSYDNLSGSVVRDSPLVQTRHAAVVGLGVFYSMWAFERPPAEAPAAAPAVE